ncbi:MAG: hypothetical protein ACJ8M4_03980 [Chthoniobacterales bacterium]
MKTTTLAFVSTLALTGWIMRSRISLSRSRGNFSTGLIEPSAARPRPARSRAAFFEKYRT